MQLFDFVTKIVFGCLKKPNKKTKCFIYGSKHHKCFRPLNYTTKLRKAKGAITKARNSKAQHTYLLTKRKIHQVPLSTIQNRKSANKSFNLQDRKLSYLQTSNLKLNTSQASIRCQTTIFIYQVLTQLIQKYFHFHRSRLVRVNDVTKYR